MFNVEPFLYRVCLVWNLKSLGSNKTGFPTCESITNDKWLIIYFLIITKCRTLYSNQNKNKQLLSKCQKVHKCMCKLAHLLVYENQSKVNAKAIETRLGKLKLFEKWRTAWLLFTVPTADSETRLPPSAYDLTCALMRASFHLSWGM